MDKLNPAELAKQYGVPRVVINPPRQWLLDWIETRVGVVRDFGGIKPAWCAVVNMPKGTEWKPYTPTTVERKTHFSMNAQQDNPGNFAAVNGLKMYYEVHGRGSPLVLLHGGGSTIESTFGDPDV